MRHKNLPIIFFVIAWVLTLNGSNVLLDWIGEIIIAAGVNPQTTTILPVIGLTLQIVLNIVAGALAYFAMKEKDLKSMSIVVLAVNAFTILNSLGTFIYAVLTGKFTL